MSAPLSLTSEALASIMTPARVEGTHGARRLLLQRERADLLGAGVAEQALDQPSPIRADYVHWIGSGSFEFEANTPSGTPTERAFLFLIEDVDSEPLDVVAWQPQRNRLGTWLGRAWALGQGSAFCPRLDPDGALPIWRTPLAWLRARRRGLVLLDLAAASDHLQCAGPLMAEDMAHGIDLRSALTRPAPRILVPAEPLREVA